MSDFLSAEWFASLNDTLASAGPAPLEGGGGVFRLVMSFADAPASVPHALTFTVTTEGATAEPGDHLAADVVVRLSYRDGEALTRGTLDSASALRESRIKVRGDVHALVALLAWLQASQ